MQITQGVSQPTLRQYAADDARKFKIGEAVMSGNDLGLNYSPSDLERLHSEAIRYLEPGIGWGQDEISAYEKTFVEPYINSSNPAYRRSALDWYQRKMAYKSFQEPAQQAAVSILKGLIPSMMPGTTQGMQTYAADLTKLASLAPYDPEVQKLASGLASKAGPGINPYTNLQTQAPLMALLAALEPDAYQAAGLPTIKQFEPSSVTPWYVRDYYQDQWASMLPYAPEGPMTKDYSGRSPGAMYDMFAALFGGGMEQARKAAEARQFPAPKDIAEATLEELKTVPTLIVGATEPATPTPEKMLAARAIEQLKRDPRLTSPRKAKSYLIGANGEAKPELVEAYGGGEEGRKRIRAIIAELDKMIDAGYADKWAPWV